jgi:phage shock protein E
MLDFLKKLFGGTKVDFATLLQNGAIIVDVRTPGEFSGGHIKGSINIPLNVLQTQMGKLKKDKAIITCCASGVRSGSAVGILKSNGFNDVYNAGSWINLREFEK